MDTKDLLQKKYNYALIVGAVTFFGTLLLLGFVIYPLYGLASTVTKEYDQKNQELTDLKNKKVVLDKLKNEESTLRKQADTVASALPESKDVGRLFIQIDALAKNSNGTIKSVTGSNGTVTTATKSAGTGFTGIQKYTYTVPVSFKSYTDMKNFISQSKNALRLLNIDNVGITAGDTGSMDVNMTITTYARS